MHRRGRRQKDGGRKRGAEGLGTAASLLMGTRARDGGGRQNRGKTGLTTQENECEKSKLRLRENRRYSEMLRPSRADCFSASTSRIVSRACSGVMIGSTVSPATARAKCSISRK